MPKDIDASFFQRKCRILVDENLGLAAAEFLRGLRYNAVYAGEVDLGGHADEDVMAYAWCDQRMLWTHDHDFLNDRRFPENRNPGLVVLPGR